MCLDNASGFHEDLIFSPSQLPFLITTGFTHEFPSPGEALEALIPDGAIPGVSGRASQEGIVV